MENKIKADGHTRHIRYLVELGGPLHKANTIECKEHEKEVDSTLHSKTWEGGWVS